MIYYIDSRRGCDRNDGQSRQTAWRTIDAVNARTLRGGDEVLLRAGERYPGTLAPRREPDGGQIRFSAYGTGEPPLIEAAGADAVRLQNIGGVTLEGLAVTAPRGVRGIHICNTAGGELKNITVRGCRVHDVNAERESYAYESGGIILAVVCPDKPGWFADVLLEDLPPLCVSLVQRRDYTSAYIDLLRSYLMEVLGGAASLPPRRGRPAKPFYNFPVLSSTAAKPAAPVHPAPGTQLPFAGATNFRELGGYPADEGKTVRWGQIWRGVCTARLTDPADRARLDALGLRLILDLRSTAEAQAEPDYVPDGARLVQICALCGDDGHEISFAPGDIERMMHTAREGENILYRMYRQMLFGNKAFKELFRALEAGETPILFHCSAGKDRTGVAAMLILLALGASDETICADFVQTNVCRKAEIDALLAGHAEEIAADPSKRMRFCTQAGVDPGAAPYVLQVIREACGSAEEYLAREYGLTPARRMRLRRMYLE